MSYWKRVGVAAVVSSAVILVGMLLASADVTVGNNNAGPVSQASTGINNTTQVRRGAAYTAPSLERAEVGTEVMQLHSFLGGVTLANTELDTRVRLKIEVIIDAYKVGLIDKETAKARIGLALNEMDSIQEERRVPLLGFSCNHRTIFNLVGMLCN